MRPAADRASSRSLIGIAGVPYGHTARAARKETPMLTTAVPTSLPTTLTGRAG